MRSPAARNDLAALGSLIASPRLCLRARCHRRVLGNISIGARGVSRQTRVVSLHRLCASFDAADRSWSMKMRAMGRGTFLAVAPFALVAALAVGVALAGFIASPHARVEQAGSVASNASASPAPTAVAVSATAEATASPSSAPSAASSTSGPKSNDAAAMLRVHNELRVAIGAPAVRADDRVTAAAQHHAEYLARAGAIGHDETAGEPGFTGASVRDRLAAQGYVDATASEVAASSDSGTEDVRFLWDLPYHRLGLMHPHAAVAGWGHAEIGGHTATVGVLVFDFAAAAPERVRSPAAGQRVAGSWAGDETPDALPAGATRPVGYPVMVVYSGARSVDLKSAKLTDASGYDVGVSVVPQIYERDYAGIVPTAPLAAGARYRVRLELSVAGTDVVDEWEFETER
ncbi:MAG: CAP domain-containing protein [Chloroflexi bacterium]|nr:MAG: CAP domain-containing protein [Chloroflexota bacterium]